MMLDLFETMERKELEAKIDKLILLLDAARPYVEYCAEGSINALVVLHKIDKLTKAANA